MTDSSLIQRCGWYDVADPWAGKPVTSVGVSLFCKALAPASAAVLAV